MELGRYLTLLARSQDELARAFDQIARGHHHEADVLHVCTKLAAQCRRHTQLLAPPLERYAATADGLQPLLHSELSTGTRSGGLGLLRDLHDLYLMVAECELAWTVVGKAAQAARDQGLQDVVETGLKETSLQLLWVKSRIQQAAPQALVVA